MAPPAGAGSERAGSGPRVAGLMIEARRLVPGGRQPAYTRARADEVLDPMIPAETQVEAQDGTGAPAFPWKLWIYTNYDCNLRCRYCVAKSSPNAPRRAIGLANVKRLVDEASQLGFVQTFFTGGEPFLLPDIYDMLAYASARLQTTVLTNAMLL